MNKKQGHLKDDDFWNDCKRDSITTNNILNKQQIKQSLIKSQSKIIKEIIDEEEQRHQRMRKASKHCFTLYNQCFIKKEIIKTKANKQMKENEKDELALCTWKPKLRSKSAFEIKLKKYSNMEMYNRGVLHKKKHDDNMAKYLYTKSLEEPELIFHPKLNSGHELQRVFQIAIKTPFERDSNKVFLCRYFKAREEEEQKKTRLITDLSKIIGKKWERRQKIKRSISARDSCIYKRTLHDSLLSFER